MFWWPRQLSHDSQCDHGHAIGSPASCLDRIGVGQRYYNRRWRDVVGAGGAVVSTDAGKTPLLLLRETSAILGYATMLLVLRRRRQLAKQESLATGPDRTQPQPKRSFSIENPSRQAGFCAQRWAVCDRSDFQGWSFDGGSGGLPRIWSLVFSPTMIDGAFRLPLGI